MNTTLVASSPLGATQNDREPSYPISVEPIGHNNIIRINQPEYLPILASLSNTWRITVAHKELNESPLLHFIATTESGQQILIFQDLFSGTWYRQYETISDQIMVRSTD